MTLFLNDLNEKHVLNIIIISMCVIVLQQPIQVHSLNNYLNVIWIIIK